MKTKTKAISLLLVFVLVLINVIGSVGNVEAQGDLTDPEIKACIQQVLGEYGITIPDSWLQVSNGRVTVWIPTTEALWNIIVGLNDALITCTGMENVEVWAGGKKLIYDMHHEGDDLIMVLDPTGPLYVSFMALIQENFEDLFLGVLYAVIVVGLDGTTLFREIVDLVPITLSEFGPSSESVMPYIIGVLVITLIIGTVLTIGYTKKRKG